MCCYLQLPANTETLKKHLLLLFDRLEKGGRLVTPGTTAGAGAGAGTAADASAGGKTRSTAGNGVKGRVDVKQAK
jgi:hypothetical protein